MMRRSAVLAAMAIGLIGPATAKAANGFVENVTVLQKWSGVPDDYFGWAVSELGDVNGDGAKEAIIGEPFTPNGTTWVYSGRTGALLYRLDGQPGDAQGYAIADAGDVNRDGIDDILSGAPGASPGRAYLYSGSDGHLLRTFTAGEENDSFGAAVSGAGDLDRDGRADVLVGAPTSSANGTNSGAAYAYSSRTGKLLAKVAGRHAGDAFGAGLGSNPGRDDDEAPTIIVGASDEQPGGLPGAGGGGVHVFSGRTGRELYSLAPPPLAGEFGRFFTAGLGRVDGDGSGDWYAGDYAAGNGNGYAGVYSGRDGSLIRSWTGGPGDGTGPGRGAGDLDRDGRTDTAVGSYTAGPAQAGRVDVYRGRDGARLRTITSTTAGENLGFDVVGVGDVNGDRRGDLLVSAAEGDTVYLIAG